MKGVKMDLTTQTLRALDGMNETAPSDDPIPAPGVKLRRITASSATAYPPAGETSLWWARLKMVFGTNSSAFVDAALAQLMAAARLPCSGISETAVNAALAMIEAAKPQNALEGALAVQAACTHTAAMAVLARLGGGHGSERRVVALATAASRLLNAYSLQMEALRRLHRGPDQVIRVERVNVQDGGQAIFAAINAPQKATAGAR